MNSRRKAGWHRRDLKLNSRLEEKGGSISSIQLNKLEKTQLYAETEMLKSYHALIKQAWGLKSGRMYLSRLRKEFVSDTQNRGVDLATANVIKENALLGQSLITEKLSAKIEYWCGAGTIRKWVQSRDGYKVYMERVIPLLSTYRLAAKIIDHKGDNIFLSGSSGGIRAGVSNDFYPTHKGLARKDGAVFPASEVTYNESDPALVEEGSGGTSDGGRVGRGILDDGILVGVNTGSAVGGGDSDDGIVGGRRGISVGDAARGDALGGG